jgi:hypothetical protein
MKKTVTLIYGFILLMAWLPLQTHAQPPVTDGQSYDSTTITFDVLSTSIDTTGVHVWQIGHTVKPFFSAGGFAVRSIMTDTLNHYPTNANDWFVVKFSGAGLNPIIDFKHKYQNTLNHDGCVVEFSADSGTTWQNVLGPCADSFGYQPGILTSNFYTNADTLADGTRAFTGSSSGWVYSRLQFFHAIPIRTTSALSPGCNYPAMGSKIYLRFRFVSDNVADTLDGWIIDSIKYENDLWMSVADIDGYKTLEVFPNPSADGIYTFPVLMNEKEYKIEVLDVLGQSLIKTDYTHSINLSLYSKGMYCYRVRGSNENYTGKLMRE